jgi:hypothetical protein
MSALHNALLPPHPPAAVSPKHVVNQKKVAQSVADLTKIALQLHLKQLEVKQRALHPEPSSPMAFVQQHPLDIHAPGQHMPRAVAAIVKGSHTPPPPLLYQVDTSACLLLLFFVFMFPLLHLHLGKTRQTN